MRLTQIVEALLFASDAPLSAGDIALIDERLDEDTVEAVVQQLREEYESQERAFTIFDIAGGYQLLTRPEFAPYLERFDTVPQQTRLSAPALEVLAVIAYRQPIGRNEIEEIRGVGSSGVLKTLQDRHLIDVVGRSEGLGRPLLYGTTPKFLEHFGFRSLEDLPRPEDMPVILRSGPPIHPVSEPATESGAEAVAPETVAEAIAEATGGSEEPQMAAAEIAAAIEETMDDATAVAAADDDGAERVTVPESEEERAE
ncbi:MAG TPA: SMC-Scp complex subunit ScpB [Longimicrobiales bacterium]|nr:SMC-Scp complex subunit ScpB [Longimicrobiales bacterium]